MMNGLLGLRLESIGFLAIVDALAGAVVLAVVVLLLASPGRARRVGTLAAAVGGGILGWCVGWYASATNLFDVALSTPIRLWAVALFGGLALAVLGIVVLRGWRLLLAALAVPLCLLAVAAGINVDVGQFPTLRAALGVPLYQPLPAATQAADAGHGVVGTAIIPATTSGFHPRPAMVYLPPVLRTAHPPVLPVIEALSGQPGNPQDLFTTGHLATVLDGWAAAHHGVAPIVVVPDQLGNPAKNPMCVDSALGNTATYLTVDVPRWIRSHYRVAAGPSGWAIAGFSQGGTCSIQLGAAHHELYGTVFDISGEIRPGSSNPGKATKTGFAGNAAAYAAAAPAAILAAHTPYRDFHVTFVVGAQDTKYRGWAETLSDAARRAGATTQLVVSPGTGHDWHTVRYALTRVLPDVLARLEVR